MPYPEIKQSCNRRILLLAGFCVFMPAAADAGPVSSQFQPEYIGHQIAPARGGDTVAGSHLHLAKIIVLKNELRARPGSDDMADQAVAPRLQSRIRRNSEFVAFVKMVRATSKRKYTAQELRDLFVSFKKWSHHNRRSNQ